MPPTPDPIDDLLGSLGPWIVAAILLLGLVVALVLLLAGRQVEAAVAGAVAVAEGGRRIRRAKQDARRRDREERAAVEKIQDAVNIALEPEPTPTSPDEVMEALEKLETRARRRTER